MNFAAALFNSTFAARITTVALLAALAGLVTDAFLKLAYGKPAPAVLPPAGLNLNTDKPVPQWLAGGDVGQAAAPSDIKLLGVVAQGNNGLQGYALIQVTGKRAQVLNVGQALPDGTQLLRVQAKTATVSIGGQPRILSLEAQGNGASAVNNAAPVMPQAYNAASADSAAQAAQQMAQIAQIQQLQQLQQASAQVGLTATEAGAVPAAEEALSGQFRRRMGGRQ